MEKVQSRCLVKAFDGEVFGDAGKSLVVRILSLTRLFRRKCSVSAALINICTLHLLRATFVYNEIVCVSYMRRNRYLLGQTDQYIREIGLKIEEQREEGRAREELEAANRPSAVEG